MIPTVKDIANLPVDKLPPLVHVPPVTRPFDVTIRPPGSKSLTNRALLLAALAEGESVLTGALADADDAQVMVRALRQLGAEIEVTPEVEPNGESCGNATIKVKGVGGRWKIKAGETVTLNLNNAGTATRFLTAAAVLQPEGSGGIVIDGNGRMRERPIGELVEALRTMGVRVEYTLNDGYPPLKIHPTKATDLTRDVRFGATQSSQFISAVMLTAPHMPRGLTINVGEVTSRAYVQMTYDCLRRAGLLNDSSTSERWRMLGGRFPPTMTIQHVKAPPLNWMIEPDASSATYPLAAATIVAGARAAVWFPDGRSLQPDDGFAEMVSELFHYDPLWREAFGYDPLEAIPYPSIDMVKMPDAVMSLAVVLAFAVGDARPVVWGVETLRVKETDRVAAMQKEFAKVGVRIETTERRDDRHGTRVEGLVVHPPVVGIDCSPSAARVEFDTYDDHRMAMSLALIGLRRPNVYIRDPGCVRKTYPTFWRDLAKLYG